MSNRSSYARLVTTASKDTRNATGSTGLKRSRSMRDSVRKFKVKLNSQVLSASPFKFHPALHQSDTQHYTKLDEPENREAIDIANTRKTSEKLFKLQAAAGMMERYTSCEATIEDLMSSMPMGTVPRKACKLLQIPETYCLKYLKEQQQEMLERQQQQNLSLPSYQDKGNLDQNQHYNYVQSNNHKNLIYEDLSKSVSQGIYGTTRHKTATIRKPMPYLNSSRCPLFVIILMPHTYIHTCT